MSLLLLVAATPTAVLSNDGGSQTVGADEHYQRALDYKLGRGVAKDSTAALASYRQAAERGHTEAQYMLGLAYLSGREIAMDRDEAIRWLQKAAVQGNHRARAFLKVMGASGTSDLAMKAPRTESAVKRAERILIEDKLCNGGFESPGSAGVFADWTAGSAGRGVVTRDTNTFHQGAASCRMEVDEEGSYVFVGLPASVGLAVGRTYRISFWAKSHGGGGIQLSSSKGGAFFSTGPLGTEFRRFEIPFVSDGGRLTIGRQFGISQGAILWIDDLVLVEVAADAE